MATFTKYLIAMIVGAVIMFLLFRQCGGKVTTPEDIEESNKAKAAIDSVVKKYEQDSILNDQLFAAAAMDRMKIENDSELYRNELLRTEGQIKYLNRVIRSAKKDSVNPIYQMSCDSLVEESERLIKQNQEYRESIAKLDTAHKVELDLRDTALSQVNIAYNSLLASTLKLRDVNDKLIKDQKRSGFQVYGGLSGIYSPGIIGAGPEVTIKTKGDKLIKASYILTSVKPLYQVGYSFKISFKK